MVQAVRYLHEAKVEEVAEKLRREGYVVKRGAEAGEREFDLVAERGDQRLAVEIKDTTQVAAAADDLMRLRNLASTRGFTDFRVFVVHRPREKRIVVPGLEIILLGLVRNGPLAEFASLSDRTDVRSVHGVDVDSIAMEADNVHVVGSAVAVVELSYADLAVGGGPSTLVAEFPIRFDLRLNRDLTLRESVSLTADTASYTGP